MSKPNNLRLVGRPEVQDDRRKEERYLINDILAGYLVCDSGRDLAIRLDDISRGGVSFLIKKESDCCAVNDVIKLNLFISHTDKFFQCEYTIKRISKDEQGNFRHSAELTNQSENRDALNSLVGFIRTVHILQSKGAA